MPELDALRERLGPHITDAELEAVLASYQALARAVASFPEETLRNLEPALRSAPAPLVA
jgi:hypothetical protein